MKEIMMATSIVEKYDSRNLQNMDRLRRLLPDNRRQGSLYSGKHYAADFLRSLPFFSGLAEPDMLALQESGFARALSKHQTLFQQGDPAESFFIVISGWIKVYRQTVDGEEGVLAILTRGDIFGEAAIFTGAGYPYAAEAAEDAHLIEIPCAILQSRARNSHDVMMRVIASMSREMRNLQIENEHMALMTAPQRVGCLLLQLTTGLSGTGGTFSFPYDKSLGAARLGMKPETFSRALAQLKRFGVSINGANVGIASFDRLIAYCRGHCSASSSECRCANARKETSDQSFPPNPSAIAVKLPLSLSGLR
jgi:CRP-like cAMP-binding protein